MFKNPQGRQEKEMGMRNRGNTQKTNNKIADIVPIMLIDIFNVNSLNISVERLKMAGWTHKQDSSLCCLQENHSKHENMFKWKTAKNTYQEKVNLKN